LKKEFVFGTCEDCEGELPGDLCFEMIVVEREIDYSTPPQRRRTAGKIDGRAISALKAPTRGARRRPGERLSVLQANQ
jgi:hypothetical protein